MKLTEEFPNKLCVAAYRTLSSGKSNEAPGTYRGYLYVDILQNPIFG